MLRARKTVWGGPCCGLTPQLPTLSPTGHSPFCAPSGHGCSQRSRTVTSGAQASFFSSPLRPSTSSDGEVAFSGSSAFFCLVTTSRERPRGRDGEAPAPGPRRFGGHSGSLPPLGAPGQRTTGPSRPDAPAALSPNNTGPFPKEKEERGEGAGIALCPADIARLSLRPIWGLFSDSFHQPSNADVGDGCLGSLEFGFSPGSCRSIIFAPQVHVQPGKRAGLHTDWLDPRPRCHVRFPDFRSAARFLPGTRN